MQMFCQPSVSTTNFMQLFWERVLYISFILFKIFMMQNLKESIYKLCPKCQICNRNAQVLFQRTPKSKENELAICFQLENIKKINIWLLKVMRLMTFIKFLTPKLFLDLIYAIQLKPNIHLEPLKT